MTSQDAGGLVLSAERLNVGTRWVPATTVTARTRIVTEVRTVEVEVRREELIIEERETHGRRRDPGSSPGSQEPTVVMLWEEVPVVSVETAPYEQVTLTVSTVAGERQVNADLAHEELHEPHT